MPQVLDNTIVAAVPEPATHSVKVTWANGETTINRFDHLVGKGVFAAVTDPAIFVQVHVGERGHSLEWPGEIDCCADALWFEKLTLRARRNRRRLQLIRRAIAPCSPGIVPQGSFPLLYSQRGAARQGDDR